MVLSAEKKMMVVGARYPVGPARRGAVVETGLVGQALAAVRKETGMMLVKTMNAATGLTVVAESSPVASALPTTLDLESA